MAFDRLEAIRDSGIVRATSRHEGASRMKSKITRALCLTAARYARLRSIHFSGPERSAWRHTARALAQFARTLPC